jgi:hypothetical protein
LTVNQDKNSDLELLKVRVYLVAGVEFKILKFGKTGSLIIDFFIRNEGIKSLCRLNSSCYSVKNNMPPKAVNLRRHKKN